MVTDEGEPKLLDFGIAKILDSAADTTVTSLRMLTPDYASPEQVTGGLITTATDIYSLGAVLYRLLTGVPPRQLGSDFVSSNPAGLNVDLLIILKKALRVEPHERYATTDQLADDLENYLEARPIRARRGDVWYRTRKFLGRFWLPVAATTLITTGSLLGLLIVNHERAIAERRFTQLRQLSNKVMDLDAAIRYLPASVEVRRRLVAASLEYLESLSKDVGDDQDLAREIAFGYERLARIQGVNTEFNLGDSASAEVNLRKADALIESVLSSHPRDRPALYRAAGIAHDRMVIARSEDRRADVLALARKVVQYLEAFLPLNDVHNTEALKDVGGNAARRTERDNVAQLYRNLSTIYTDLGLYAEGTVYARRAVALAHSIGSLALEGGSLRLLADALRNQGELDEALTAMRQARKISRQAVYPNSPDLLFSTYGPALQEGLILGEADSVNLGRPAEAIEDIQKALDIAEVAARKDENDSASRTRVGIAAWALGDILRDRDAHRALAVYDLGIKRLAEVRGRAEPDRTRVILLAGSSYVLRHLERAAEAKARIDNSFKILTELKDYPAESIRLDSSVEAVIEALADHEAATGNLNRAVDLYDDLLQKVFKSAPEPESKLPEAARLTRLYQSAANLNRKIGRNEVAAGLETRSLDLWRHWDARLPNNSFVRRQLNSINIHRQ
jgi:tetratricopeptide (TPR) repeat protein